MSEDVGFCDLCKDCDWRTLFALLGLLELSICLSERFAFFDGVPTAVMLYGIAA